MIHSLSDNWLYCNVIFGQKWPSHQKRVHWRSWENREKSEWYWRLVNRGKSWLIVVNKKSRGKKWFIAIGNILIGCIMTVNGFSISCLEENYYHKVIRSYLHISQWEIILWISFFEKFTVTKLVTPDVKLVFSHFSLPQKL